MVDYGGGKKASHGRAASSFADIVGQAAAKRALLAVGANPELDGLLLQGEKGTAKSTAVRALSDLLPDQRVVADCPYGCPPDAPERQCDSCRDRTDPPTTERPVPLVTLPLGATRERVVGTLSVADALAGDYEFDPGLLARANRGILYVDEVNLLDDHLVDVLLDAAASGQNRVERDGVSVAHPAEFTIVGTMNPEEGELRPQLRDRFALQATVTGCPDIDDRVAIVEQALGERDAETVETDDRSDPDRREQLRRASERLPDVTLPTELVADIAECCRDAGVDGHRADIATARTARTLAALDGRSKVIEPDVREAATLALPHRLQSRPFEDAPDPSDVIDDHFEDDHDGGSEQDSADAGAGGDTDGTGDDGEQSSATERDRSSEPESDGDEQTEHSEPGSGEPDDGDTADGPRPGPQPEASTDDGAAGDEGGGAEESGDDSGTGDSDDSDDEVEGTPLLPGQSRTAVGESAAPDIDTSDAVEGNRGEQSGSRTRTRPSVDGTGARVRTERADAGGSVDASASVRAAASRGASSVESRDLRQSVRQRDSGALVVFAVDASASMRSAMRAAKGTVLELLKDAYQHRDEVAFVAFAGDDADVLLPPTDSVTLAARHLKDLPTGDRTPLPTGLRTASEVVDRADPAASVAVVVTDGRANVGERPTAATREAARLLGQVCDEVVVVDAGGDGRAGLIDVVTEATDGTALALSDLHATTLDRTVGTARGDD